MMIPGEIQSEVVDLLLVPIHQVLKRTGIVLSNPGKKVLFLIYHHDYVSWTYSLLGRFTS
jgi:hypothetical protein